MLNLVDEMEGRGSDHSLLKCTVNISTLVDSTNDELQTSSSKSATCSLTAEDANATKGTTESRREFIPRNLDNPTKRYKMYEVPADFIRYIHSSHHLYTV